MFGLAFVYPEALWLVLLAVPIWGLALRLPHRMAPWQLWGSLALRSLLLLTLVFSLAGTQLVQPVGNLTTVFLLDRSDSISPSMHGQAEAFIQAAIQQMPSGDRAALVVFGDQALVEQAPNANFRIEGLTMLPNPARTNLEQAIELGLALLPADTQKRLVLLSDGGENSGNAQTAARLASSQGVPIDVVDLSGAGSTTEALVTDLAAPRSVREGQEFDLLATVMSTTNQNARLQVLDNEQVVVDQEVVLANGTNEFRFTVPAKGQGFHRYRVEINPAQDARSQNNQVTTLVQVQGSPRVLLVALQPNETEQLQAALQVANISAETVSPAAMPSDLAGLSSYDAVVLVNVPAHALPPAAMAFLPAYVRDLGKGLVMIGGTESYGVGGYNQTPIEEALPVYMNVRNREERPDLALVFVIDKSGSMDTCHCSSTDRQSLITGKDGQGRKIDIAKEAIMQASTVLSEQDTLGIVAFDNNAHWVLPATRGASAEQVAAAISDIEPRGTTNVRAGLQAAQTMLQQSDARIKHVILLTDGWGYGGDNIDLAEQMHEQGMTLTVVAAGSGSASYLERLANSGGGRYYPSQTMADVPQIFLQETIITIGNYIIEGPVVPVLRDDNPIMDGFNGRMPQLYGYNGTTIKETARHVLMAPDETPLLAQWQYGLGRSIAWTSDFTGKWGRDLVQWDQFPRFVAQMLGWVLPTRSSQSITTDLQVEGSLTSVRVQVDADTTRPHTELTMIARLVGSDGSTTEVPLSQVAPGDYRAQISSPAPGTYLVQVAGAVDGRTVVQEIAGLVVPYSPEYRPNPSNPTLLSDIAALTGGRVLEAALDVFAPTGISVQHAQEINLPLLICALILLPLDIAVRRLPPRRPTPPPLL